MLHLMAFTVVIALLGAMSGGRDRKALMRGAKWRRPFMSPPSVGVDTWNQNWTAITTDGEESWAKRYCP